MKEQILLNLTIESSDSALPEIREQIMGQAESIGTDSSVLQRLDLVLEEALLNVMRHGYKGSSGIIEVTLSATADGSLKLAIIDSGIPFNPLSIPPPDLTLPLEERTIGGLGVHLIRSMTDEAAYYRKNNRNLLVLTFTRPEST